MKKYKFEPDTWIIFDYNGGTAIGRTFYGSNRDECVASVSESGEMRCILYSEIELPRKLSILSKKSKKSKNTANNSAYFLNGVHGGEA